MLNNAGKKVKQTGFLIVLSLMLSGAGCFMFLAIKRHETISYLDQSLADVPLYAHATLVYSSYYGCLKPENKNVTVVYATNDSPKAVRTFFRAYVQASHWQYGGEWESGQDVGEPERWFLSAYEPSDGNYSFHPASFSLQVVSSEDAASNLHLRLNNTKELVEDAAEKYAYLFSIGLFYAEAESYQGWISKSDPLAGRCEIGQWKVLKP